MRNRWLDPKTLSEAQHGEIEAFLDILVAAGIAQLLIVYLVALCVPSFMRQVGVHFGLELVLDRSILIHVHVLDQIVHADLGRGDSRQVNEGDIVEHCLIG